jgi:hypothetical protein
MEKQKVERKWVVEIKLDSKIVTRVIKSVNANKYNEFNLGDDN